MSAFALPLTRRRSLAMAAAFGAAALSPVRAAGAPLRVGLAPFLSPTVLLTAFRAVREHLERSLDRPVEMLTAKDFRSLVEATAVANGRILQRLNFHITVLLCEAQANGFAGNGVIPQPFPNYFWDAMPVIS